jgi:hypothetical protein
MLAELRDVRQIEGEHRRRWFADDFFDLIVWLGDGGEPVAFQLCYDKEGHQRALTWKAPSSYTHTGIDDGENRPGRYKATPILVADGAFDHSAIGERFRRAAAGIDPAIAELVHAKLMACGLP